MKIHCEPGFDNKSWMLCDWMDENNQFIFQERTYWPKHVLTAHVPTVEYWITNQLYTSSALAEAEAKQFGFTAQKGFYCHDDDPHWFPIFRDFNKVLDFLRDKTGISYSGIDFEK